MIMLHDLRVTVRVHNLIHSELLGQFRESDLGCMYGVLLCTKLQHSVHRKNMRKNIVVLKHNC